jgi:hypothetical protein
MVEEFSERLAATARSLHEQAARCRRLARLINDRQAARALLDLSEELEQKAEEKCPTYERGRCRTSAEPVD